VTLGVPVALGCAAALWLASHACVPRWRRRAADLEWRAAGLQLYLRVIKHVAPAFWARGWDCELVYAEVPPTPCDRMWRAVCCAACVCCYRVPPLHAPQQAPSYYAVEQDAYPPDPDDEPGMFAGPAPRRVYGVWVRKAFALRRPRGAALRPPPPAPRPPRPPPRVAVVSHNEEEGEDDEDVSMEELGGAYAAPPASAQWQPSPSPQPLTLELRMAEARRAQAAAAAQRTAQQREEQARGGAAAVPPPSAPAWAEIREGWVGGAP
jgi:hypothetical protein